MSEMHNPTHPGATLREDILPSLGLTVTEAADQLDVDRSTFSRVINERAAISPEMALRIEKWLGVENGGRADVWMAEQAAYDLWQKRMELRARPRSGALLKIRRAKIREAVPA